MKKIIRIAAFFVAAMVSSSGYAFNNGAFYLGVGYFSENSFGKVTRSSTGEQSTLGSASFPLILKYDWQFGYEYFFAPTLTYTPIGRRSAGDSTRVTMAHLMMPIGQNFSFLGMDWYVGPGILTRIQAGSGGFDQLSNGSSVSTFARPGRSVTTMNLSLNAGSSLQQGPSRFGLDFIGEGLLSSQRGFSLMLSYCYQLSGGMR